MAFTDTLVAQTDAEVVLVDRRHRPGGHWLDAYPFVRLHQPSAYYGVESRPLGNDRIDEHGPNAGFYERATADEICDYYSRVLDGTLLPTGRVRFSGMSEYRGGNRDGHLVVSLLDGSETVVKARRKVVDATYVQSEIPSRHVPAFTVEPGVTLVSPNALVDLVEPPDRFTVIGAGKTALDTCVWLLESGVDPDRIRWIRGRDPWQFDRTFTQPLELVASFMRLQACWVEAAAAAEGGHDLPNPWVIHCLGPVYGVDEPAEELLASCYRQALELADARGLGSLAFPAISTGAFGYPVEPAAEVALRTVVEVAPRLACVRRVRFVLRGAGAAGIHRRVLEGITDQDGE